MHVFQCMHALQIWILGRCWAAMLSESTLPPDMQLSPIVCPNLWEFALVFGVWYLSNRITIW